MNLLETFENESEQEWAFSLIKEAFLKLEIDLEKAEEDKRICLTYKNKQSLRFTFGWINWLILSFGDGFLKLSLFSDEAEQYFQDNNVDYSQWKKDDGIENRYFQKGIQKSDPRVSFYTVSFTDFQTYSEIKGIFFKTLDYILSIKNIRTTMSTPLRKNNNAVLVKAVIQSQAKTNMNNLDTISIPKVPESYPGFNPENEEDARRRIEKSIVIRQGQKELREALLQEYKVCCISKCSVKDVLEAAHIKPYRNQETNHPSNALLLRADLHTLLDRNLIGIDPQKYQIKIHPLLKGSEYESFQDQLLQIPFNQNFKPNQTALQQRYQEFENNLGTNK